MTQIAFSPIYCANTCRINLLIDAVTPVKYLYYILIVEYFLPLIIMAICYASISFSIGKVGVFFETDLNDLDCCGHQRRRSSLTGSNLKFKNLAYYFQRLFAVNRHRNMNRIFAMMVVMFALR